MKQKSSFSILLTLASLFLISNLATASIAAEATEIPYQVSDSDRIIIGTVSEIDTYYGYTIYTITVKEWLYNPIPADIIKVRSEIGTNLAVENEVVFVQNESALLMLKDENISKHLFRVPLGLKYPVSDRDTVIKELKVQGKWKGEDEAKTDISEGRELTFGPEPTVEINDSKLLNESNSNVNNSSSGRAGVISSTPGFELFGSLTCLYVGWKLRRIE